MASATPRLLILETSGRAGRVALAEGQQLRAERPLDEMRRHARDLAPAVAELLSNLAWRPKQIDAVIVSRGPGSYTGLRVGIMSAKAFAYATGCALVAVDSFAAIALQAPRDGSRLDVIADAQQQKVYVQSFARDSAGLRRSISDLAIQPLADWMANLTADVHVSGPGLEVYASELPGGVRMAPVADWHPHAESLLRLGLERYQRGERDDVWRLEPLYLRPSSAEEKHAGR